MSREPRPRTNLEVSSDEELASGRHDGREECGWKEVGREMRERWGWGFEGPEKKGEAAVGPAAKQRQQQQPVRPSSGEPSVDHHQQQQQLSTTMVAVKSWDRFQKETIAVSPRAADS
jgi:hypothetical protein